MWPPLAWIIATIHQGRDAYKSFTIFTGMRYHSLWLSSHISSRLCGFFWQTLLFSSVYIFSMIFNSGLWASQYLGRGVHLHKPNSSVLYTICGMELLHAEKSQHHPSLESNCSLASGYIQVTIKFYQLSQTITFYVFSRYQALTPNFTVFVMYRGLFRFPGSLLTNSFSQCCTHIRCKCIVTLIMCTQEQKNT